MLLSELHSANAIKREKVHECLFSVMKINESAAHTSYTQIYFSTVHLCNTFVTTQSTLYIPLRFYDFQKHFYTPTRHSRHTSLSYSVVRMDPIQSQKWINSEFMHNIYDGVPKGGRLQAICLLNYSVLLLLLSPPKHLNILVLLL